MNAINLYNFGWLLAPFWWLLTSPRFEGRARLRRVLIMAVSLLIFVPMVLQAVNGESRWLPLHHYLAGIGGPLSVVSVLLMLWSIGLVCMGYASIRKMTMGMGVIINTSRPVILPKPIAWGILVIALLLQVSALFPAPLNINTGYAVWWAIPDIMRWGYIGGGGALSLPENSTNIWMGGGVLIAVIVLAIGLYIKQYPIAAWIIALSLFIFAINQFFLVLWQSPFLPAGNLWLVLIDPFWLGFWVVRSRFFREMDHKIR